VADKTDVGVCLKYLRKELKERENEPLDFVEEGRGS
jgi:hypothetical protein